MNGIVNRAFTIFGGTGDLTFRKLIPALYHLYLRHQLDHQTKIVIIGRRDYTQEIYCDQAKSWVQESLRFQFKEEEYKNFCSHIHYFKMDFTKIEHYERLNNFYHNHNIKEHIFYYAVAPEYFDVLSTGIMGMENTKEAKIVIEKPFGSNLEEAKKLNECLERNFKLENIYRIDHYLGKEMIRSIQTIRFTNPIFSTAWNKEYIEKVEIFALEEIGVESRGSYYDLSGALKDMVQNHLFQILSIVAMEKPEDDKDIQKCQLDVLKSLRPVEKIDIQKSMILGQYKGYHEEKNVAANSKTETFASLTVYIDNKRWEGVPFFITTGKKLRKKGMEVVLTFKKENQGIASNILKIKIQPQEGVSFQFNIKKPGDSEEIIQTEMDFCQNCIDRFRINTPEAYERLLAACFHSEQTWFSKWDQIEKSWLYINQLKEEYIKKELPLYSYEQGSDGPKGIE